MNIKKPQLLEIMVCPSCKGSLRPDDERCTLVCRKCRASYHVIDGVPVLLKSENAKLIGDILRRRGKDMVTEYQCGPKRRGRRFIKPPDLLYQLEPDLASAEMDGFYDSAKSIGVVVSIGGGPIRHRSCDINLNIGLFPNVDVVADGHDIPVEDESVGAVICKAVLEHVDDPALILREIYRILKPGGVVYVDIPFLFIAHYYPKDISRFTMSGVEHLMERFEKIKSGISIGPFSTMLLLFNDFLIEVFNCRNKNTRKIISGIVRTMFFPFKYLDIIFKNRKVVPDFAGAYYFIGQKRKD